MKNYIQTTKDNYKLYRCQYEQKQYTFVFMPTTTPCLKTQKAKDLKSETKGSSLNQTVSFIRNKSKLFFPKKKPFSPIWR